MATYCSEAEVKAYGGTYINKNVPSTLPVPWARFITDVSNEIDSWLSEVGVIIPIDSAYTHALARLKELACIGVLAKSEESIGFASNPIAGNIARGTNYKDRYQELFGIPKEKDKFGNPIYGGYLHSPRRRLFAGDSNTDAAFNVEESIRPVGNVIWSYTAANDKSIGIGFDTEF